MTDKYRRGVRYLVSIKHGHLGRDAEVGRLACFTITLFVSLLVLFFFNGLTKAQDEDPPEVVWVWPPDESELSSFGWRSGMTWLLRIEFSEPMNQSSVENSTSIAPNAEYTPYDWTENGTVYEFLATLDHGKTYHLTLTESAKDINETAMEAPYAWSYTLKAEDQTSSPFWPILANVFF